nr:hypothetical protein [Desulfuromonadales bacterium]
MKGLDNVAGLAKAPALRELNLIDMGHQLQPDDWAQVLDNPALKKVA